MDWFVQQFCQPVCNCTELIASSQSNYFSAEVNVLVQSSTHLEVHVMP